MDKYRNSSSVSLSSSTNRLLNSGPLHTMCGSNAQQGLKLLINSVSVGTATKFQFVPARNSSTNFSGPFQLGMGTFTPIFNTVRTFFANLIKPNVDVDTNSTDNTIEKRKCNSASNIYMDIMSDRKISDDFDKNCVVDLTNLKMLAKLSSVPAENSSQPSGPVPLLQQNQKTNCFKMPNVLIKPRTQCRNGKRTKKEKVKKTNKNESKRHELAFKIHEDIETETETMSTDEWDEPLVIITATKITETEPQTKNTASVATFSEDDFPAMPECNVWNATNNSIQKQTWELPRLSHRFSVFNGKNQRRISDCDSEDSFIVFENDDNSTLSSVESNKSICDRIQSTLGTGRQRQISEGSEDDFICFELEESDTDEDSDDEDCCQMVTSDSDCESEVESCGTNQPDSGFEDKKVRFNPTPVVHVMRAWQFAYQQTRKGQVGRDRVRFLERVKRMESILLPILDSSHRQKIYNERFFNSNDSTENECQ